MAIRRIAKKLVNRLAGAVGARVVGVDWGPRGFESAFKRAKQRGLSPQTVLDIGASDGSWTRACRAIFPDASYFLADPLEENKGKLSVLAINSPRMHLWNGAIGARPGALELTVHGDQSSFLDSLDFAGKKRTVPVRTLDSFFDEVGFDAPILLKADVQGFELEVLKGAPKCIELTEVMLLEVSFRRVYSGPLANEVIAELSARGFRVYDIVSYVQREDGELVQADIVFARDGGILFSSERYTSL